MVPQCHWRVNNNRKVSQVITDRKMFVSREYYINEMDTSNRFTLGRLVVENFN